MKNQSYIFFMLLLVQTSVSYAQQSTRMTVTPTPTPTPILEAEIIVKETSEDTKTEHTEVLLVIDSRAMESSVEALKARKFYTSTTNANFYIKNTEFKLPSSYDVSLIKKFMINVINENTFSDYYKISEINLNDQFHRSLFLESIMKISIINDIPSHQQAESLANLIMDTFNKTEDRFDFLSLIAERLYDNYNDARNPFGSNQQTNPKNVALPKGIMTQSQLFKAAFEKDIFQGGVCNDIAHVIAEVGEKIFPELDVLVISGGTHIGTIFTDGETTRVIDDDKQMITKNIISLHNDITHATNIRVSKVVDGKLKEIAILETEQGLLINSALSIDRPTISTSWPRDKVLGQVKKVIETKKSKKELILSTAAANLSRSKMMVIAGKFDLRTKNDKRHFYTGLALANQVPDVEQTLKNGAGSIHLRIGFEEKFILYSHPRVKLEFVGGIHGEGGFGVERHLFDYAGTINLEKSLRAQYIPKSESGLSVQSKVSVLRSYGPKDYGETTGSLSKFSISNLPRFFSAMRFNLNNVVFDTKVQKKINSKMSAQGGLTYQGSNIGQNIESNAGVSILSNSKYHQLYVYVGYDNSELKGYKTQHNLLAGFNGGKVGLNYQHKKGAQFEFSLRAIGASKENSNYSASLKVPLYSSPKVTTKVKK